MNNNEAKVISINISSKKGMRKKPVNMARCEKGGFIDDAHFDADSIRQISLLANESIDKMREFTQLNSGDFAENITTSGIVLNELPIGTRLLIGETEHVVSKIGKECHQGCEIRRIVGDCIMPREGIFTVVEKGGVIKVGDKIKIL